MITQVALLDRLSGQRSSPLVRSGIHLITSAGLTSVLGLAYWSLAAHRYSAAAVGATAGLLAAMELIAAVANLGLRTALIRFVPSLGRQVAGVVALSYLVTGAVALVGAACFVAVHGRFFPELHLLDGASGATFFMISTVLWVVFILQDSVLIGMRCSSWLPVENALYSVAKLGLLLVLTVPMPQWGIYVSWSLPLLVVVVAINVPVFTRLHRRPQAQATEVVTLADLVRFSAGDYLASTLWLATIDGLPLLVLALASARANASYHLAWTVAYTIYLIPSALGSALVAEAAHDAPELEANTRRAFVMSFALVLPATAALVLGAPLVLDIFGRQYSSDATTLLRLIALSAVPYAVTILYVNVERGKRRIATVVRLYAVMCAGLLFGSAVLVPRFGVTGTGFAWLGVQTGVALWLLGTRLQDLWVGALPTPLIRWLGAPQAWLDGRRLRRRAVAAVPTVLGRIQPEEPTWRLLHVTPDLIVAAFDDPSTGERVLKLPTSHEAELGRRRELAALGALRSDPRTSRWSAAAPTPIGHGTTGDQAWSVETAVRGTAGDAALEAGLAPELLLARASSLVSGLHRATAGSCFVDEELVRAWVDEPAAQVAAACPEAGPGVNELARTLRAVLSGRQVTVAWTHGDVSPANLMVDASGAVAGLVDWETARGQRLPEIDLVGLIASVRAGIRTEEFGEVTLALVRRPWTEEEIRVLDQGPNGHLPRPALVLLAWLHHIAANLAKSGGYGANRVWVLRNVLAVTADMAMPTAAMSPPPSVESVPEAHAAPMVEPATQPGPPLRTRNRRPREWSALAWVVPPIAVVAWFVSLIGSDPRQMSDVGLVSVLSPVSYLALVLLVVGFAFALVRRPFGEQLVAAHAGGLALMLFATPPVFYATLRYSWAWKHVGIVDYISRHGNVDPGIDVLAIYHNWPGFFAGSHLLQTWVGADDVITIGRWAPLVMILATAAAVNMLAATFTADRRVVWLTTWLFLLGDWVGQEYFSPQAMAYLLYLVAISLALRMAGKGTKQRGATGVVTVLTVVLLAMAIASSHQLTPAMLCVALVALTLTGRARLHAVAVVAMLVTVTWALWGASDFVVSNIRTAVEGFGSPMANAEGSLTDASRLSHGQVLVALAGRGLVVALAVLTVVGLVRLWRRDRRAVITPFVLLVIPMVILAANEFGGEILFRVYLFALPMAAWFAAYALLDLPRLRGRLAVVAPLVVSLLLVPGFLLAHFGKDGHYVFTPEEVAAATWLDEHAPAGSVLVEGSANYPVQFRNYEHFRYVPLDTESVATRRDIQRHPLQVMGRWLSDPRDAGGYLLITRSQQREAAAMGYRPRTFLNDLEVALLASDQFKVAYRNRDAVIFTWAGRSS